MRLSFYSVVGVLIIVAMGYAARPTQVNHTAPYSATQIVTEGAYRDGLYLGRMHRSQGLPSRPARGRWSRESDRQLFETGYNRGYNGQQE